MSPADRDPADRNPTGREPADRNRPGWTPRRSEGRALGDPRLPGAGRPTPGRPAPGRPAPGDPLPDPVPSDIPIDVDPGGGGVPLGGGVPPDGPIRGLDPQLPLALFPIRLATRFVRTDGAALSGSPADPLHPGTDHGRHPPGRTDRIRGRSRPRLLAAPSCRRARRRCDRRRETWLIDSLGAPRARWVALQTRPTNAASGADAAQLKFPPVRIDKSADPAVVRLLPDRWIVQVRTGDDPPKRYASRPIDPDHPLVAAPQLVTVPDATTARGFLRRPGIGWRTDFAAAVQRGMAIEIPVEGPSRQAGFDELLVFGVRAGDQSATVVSLLDHHRYGPGLTLLPAGTPTNNTDDGRVPASNTATPELEPPQPGSAAAKPADPAPLYERSNAEALAAALGIGDTDVLDDAPIADRADGRWSRAINQVLWSGLTVQLFDHLLRGVGPVIGGSDRTWLRDWFYDYVRGGPLLPTLGVGSTPYGVLPTMGLPDPLAEPAPGDQRGTFVAQVVDWEQAWTGSTAPALSPVLDDDPTDADQAVEVAAILGAVPNPTTLRVRPAPLQRPTIADEFGDAESHLDDMVSALPPPNGASLQAEYDAHRQRVQGPAPAISQRSSLSTFVFWVNNSASLFDDLEPNPARAIIDHVEQVMYPMLEDHESRTRSMVIDPELGVGKLPWDTDPDLWYVNYTDLAADAPVASLIGDHATLLEGLDQRLELAETKAAGGDVTVDSGVARPLLFVLIDQSIRFADGAEAALADGLRTLRDLVAHEDEGIDILDRITREALGLFTHRIDAWRTSIPAERVATSRARHPRGLQSGCYGFVVDLRPDDATPDTQGFLHAPSLDQAAAGAMLRSAWRGLGRRPPMPPSPSTCRRTACAARCGSSTASGTETSSAICWVSGSNGGSTTAPSTPTSRTCGRRCWRRPATRAIRRPRSSTASRSPPPTGPPRRAATCTTGWRRSEPQHRPRIGNPCSTSSPRPRRTSTRSPTCS